MIIFDIITTLLYFVVGYYIIRLPYLYVNGFFKSGPKRNSIMLIFGSGGHTTELLLLFKDFDFKKWNNIYFVKAETDKTSEKKISDFIKSNDVKINLDKVTWITIPRSREVGQSYGSSVFTTLRSLFMIYYQFTKLGHIDVTICNGPGTCVPVVFVQLLNRILLLARKTKLIFVESYCRVNTLSLSGKILYPIADRFIVHWPELTNKYKKAQYYGTLV